MKFKGTLALAVVFAGIVLYYFFMEIPAEKRQKEEKELSEKVLVFRAEDVDELSIVRKDQSVVVRRKGADPWEISQPLNAKADQSSVETFLDKLRDVRFSRVVEENPADLSVYGLKDPATRISIKAKDPTPVVLSIGDKSPIGQSIYLKRDDQKRVLLAQSSPKNWEVSLFDLRDKSIFTYKTQDVVEMKIQRSGAPLRLFQEDKIWKVEGNAKAKGDPKDIEDMLNSLRAVRISAFIEENPKDLSVFGLSPNAIKATIGLAEKGAKQSLTIGAKNGTGKYYAKTDQAENVFAVDSHIVEILTKSESNFLDKTLLDFKEENVTELRLRDKDENILVRRDAGDTKKWKIEKPILAESDSAAVNNLLQDLKTTRIAAYTGSSEADLASHGLDSPQKQLLITSKDNSVSGIKVGLQSDDKNFYYAMRENEKSVFTLQAESVNKIFRSLRDLQNRRILKFNSDSAAKISIQYPDKTFELNKNGEDWSLSLPKPIKKIRPFIGKDILWTLSNLEFEAVDDPSAGKTETGFDRPNARITVTDKQGRIIANLSVGKKIQSQYYAQTEGSPAIYRIKDRFMSEIPGDLKKFEE